MSWNFWTVLLKKHKVFTIFIAINIVLLIALISIGNLMNNEEKHGFFPKSRIKQPPSKFEVQNAKINALIAYRKLHPKIRLAYESDIDVPIY